MPLWRSMSIETQWSIAIIDSSKSPRINLPMIIEAVNTNSANLSLSSSLVPLGYLIVPESKYQTPDTTVEMLTIPILINLLPIWLVKANLELCLWLINMAFQPAEHSLSPVIAIFVRAKGVM